MELTLEPRSKATLPTSGLILFFRKFSYFINFRPGHYVCDVWISPMAICRRIRNACVPNFVCMQNFPHKPSLASLLKVRRDEMKLLCKFYYFLSFLGCIKIIDDDYYLERSLFTTHLCYISLQIKLSRCWRFCIWYERRLHTIVAIYK